MGNIQDFRGRVGAEAFETLQRLQPGRYEHVKGRKDKFLMQLNDKFNQFLDFFKTLQFTNSNQACVKLDKTVKEVAKEIKRVDALIEKGGPEVEDAKRIREGMHKKIVAISEALIIIKASTIGEKSSKSLQTLYRDLEELKNVDQSIEKTRPVDAGATEKRTNDFAHQRLTARRVPTEARPAAEQRRITSAPERAPEFEEFTTKLTWEPRVESQPDEKRKMTYAEAAKEGMRATAEKQEATTGVKQEELERMSPDQLRKELTTRTRTFLEVAKTGIETPEKREQMMQTLREVRSPNTNFRTLRAVFREVARLAQGRTPDSFIQQAYADAQRAMAAAEKRETAEAATPAEPKELGKVAKRKLARYGEGGTRTQKQIEAPPVESQAPLSKSAKRKKERAGQPGRLTPTEHRAELRARKEEAARVQQTLQERTEAPRTEEAPQGQKGYFAAFVDACQDFLDNRGWG